MTLTKKNPIRLMLAVCLLSAGSIAAPLAAEAASPPSCVSTTSWSSFPWQWAKATNNCSGSQRFYFRWDRAVDGGCNTYSPGAWRQEGRAYQARFAGLTNC